MEYGSTLSRLPMNKHNPDKCWRARAVSLSLRNMHSSEAALLLLLYMHADTRTPRTHRHTHRRTYTNTYTRACIHTHISISIYLSIYLSVCLYVCLSVCLPVCLSICLPIHVYIDTYIYTYIHTCSHPKREAPHTHANMRARTHKHTRIRLRTQTQTCYKSFFEIFDAIHGSELHQSLFQRQNQLLFVDIQIFSAPATAGYNPLPAQCAIVILYAEMVWRPNAKLWPPIRSCLPVVAPIRCLRISR